MPASKPNPSNSSNNTTATVVTIILLLFLTPVGIIVMWFWPKWPTWVKILLTVLSVLMIIPAIAILGTIMFLVINPVELRSMSDDVTRLSDTANVAQAINQQILESEEPFNMCGEKEPPCQLSSDKTVQWVPFKLKFLNGPLPLDPLNNELNKYTYCTDGADWEINTVINSEKYVDKMAQDGGDNPKVFERGSKLTLCQ